MNKSDVPYRQQQKEVNAYFQAQSSYWKDIYTSRGVQAEIYRLRQALVLAWIDDLALAPGSRVLDVGCGAGFLSVELAKRGLRVHAIDSAETMVELVRQHAAESGVTELLSVGEGDVYALDFKDDSFDLVIALGVLPWLARPELAIREMARVTVPGTHMILTADNRKRLNYLLDPGMNQALIPLRRWLKSILEQIRILHKSQGRTRENLYDCHFIDQTLVNARLNKVRGTTIGFGPFTFLGRRFLSEPHDILVHSWMQRLADRSLPGFRSSGSQYLVLARKLISRPFEQTTSTANSSPTPHKYHKV